LPLAVTGARPATTPLPIILGPTLTGGAFLFCFLSRSAYSVRTMLAAWRLR